MRRPTDRQWRWLAYALLAAVFLIAAFTARDYGLTWDEENHRVYGDAVLNWYSSQFSDDTALSVLRNVDQYGGFFDAIAQLAAKVSPHGVYETRHATSTLFGFLGIIGTYVFGARLAGALAGLFAALFLTLTPAYYGQMFNNPKDIPFAALFTLSLYSLVLVYDALPRPSWKLIVAAGVAVGLTMAVRVGGVMLFGYLALIAAAWLARYYFREARPSAKSLAPAAIRIVLSVASICILAWLVMLLWWPWGQVSPILNPLDALRRTADFDWPLTVYFKGKDIQASQLPPDYLPTWLAISLPEFYFVALAAGTGLALRAAWIRQPKAPFAFDQSVRIGLLLLAAIFPILAAIALHTTLYDGLRQFLFVVPCLATLAGVSLASLLRSRAARLLKAAAVSAVLFSCGLTVFDMAELHPYEYIFFNRAVAGGFASGASSFETDYYGASYREGIRWVIDNYHPESSEPIRVANPSKDFLTGYYLQMTEELRSRFVMVPVVSDPNIYISTTRWNKQRALGGTVLHIVQRMGVPLLYVIEVRKPN